MVSTVFVYGTQHVVVVYASFQKIIMKFIGRRIIYNGNIA